MLDGPRDPKQLREWRVRLDYTQAEAAEKLMVTRATVQNWESGATPVPAWVPTMCQRVERKWKQSNPTYGPVALLYCDGPMTQPIWGPARLPMMHREPWPTMEEAIQRACSLTGSEHYRSGLIVDEDATIWGSSELAKECQSRLNKNAASPRS
jgi:DNA-binding XRE family transcriptional regulator